MRIEALDAPLGARVHELDVAAGLDRAESAALRDAIDRYAVLALPGQDLDDAAQVAFSESFGELETPLDLDQYAGVHPLVTRLANVDGEDRVMPPDSRHATYMKGNQLWHTDSSFRPLPSKCSLLYGRSIPPVGGQTEFADLRAAYDALPEDMKTRLEGLVAEHSIRESRAASAW